MLVLDQQKHKPFQTFSLCSSKHIWITLLWNVVLPALITPSLEAGEGMGSKVSEAPQRSGRKEADRVLQKARRWGSFLPSALSKAKTNTSGSST